MTNFLFYIFLTMLAGCTSANIEQTTEVYKSADQLSTLEVVNESIDQKSKIKAVLLVPLTGKDEKTGKNILDAAQQAAYDLEFVKLRLTPVDLSLPAKDIIKRLEREKPDVILGPASAKDIRKIAPYASKNHICIISFSNDTGSTGEGCVMLLGIMPYASVNQVMDYAKAQGLHNIYGFLPKNHHGKNLALQLKDIKYSYYPIRKPKKSKIDAKKALGSDAILISANREEAVRIASSLKALSPKNSFKLLGSDLWEDKFILKNSIFEGAWFASLSGINKEKFEQKFIKTFAYKPMEIAILGYDAVSLLAALTASESFNGLTKEAFTDPAGFIGVSGPFRFLPDGSNERPLAIYEIYGGEAIEVQPVKESFY